VPPLHGSATTDFSSVEGNHHHHIPKTPRAVSRTTRSAIALVTHNPPSSEKLKTLLSILSDGFQQTISDKVLAEESYKQYRDLVGGAKMAKTSDRRRLAEPTVITTETVIQLREERERVDAAKAARQARKLTKVLDALSLATTVGIPKTQGTGSGKGKGKGKAIGGGKGTKVAIADDIVGGSACPGGQDIEWEDGTESDGSQYMGRAFKARKSVDMDSDLAVESGTPLGRINKEHTGLGKSGRVLRSQRV